MAEQEGHRQPLGSGMPHTERLRAISDQVEALSLAVRAELDSVDPFTHEQRYALRGLDHVLDQAARHASNLRESLPQRNPQG